MSKQAKPRALDDSHNMKTPPDPQMPIKTKKPTWTSVRSKLQQMDTGALMDLLKDLYRTNKDNQRFLHARLLDSQIELEQYRKLVEDAVYPNWRGQQPVRIGEAKQLIRHYRQATMDIEGTVDLMLTFVKAGTEQAANLGYGEGKYFAALEKTLDEIHDALAELSPEWRRHAADRLQEIAFEAKSIGWGYGDYAQKIAGRANKALTSAAGANRSGARPRLGGSDGPAPARIGSHADEGT